MGALLSKWLIAEDLLTFSFTRHLIGAVANVGLNLLLIPKYGGTGAAVATLVAYTLASYGACFTDPRTRVAGRMMTRAMLTPLLILRRS
jgi:O-antigen/teichoic acid export membrane protein